MMRTTDVPPLEDPAYVPQHPPVNGIVPDVVRKWGPRSQIRWFDRFRDQLARQPFAFWDGFYAGSELHRGECCSSCIGDQNEGYYDMDECCCRAFVAREEGGSK